MHGCNITGWTYSARINADVVWSAAKMSRNFYLVVPTSTSMLMRCSRNVNFQKLLNSRGLLVVPTSFDFKFVGDFEGT